MKGDYTLGGSWGNHISLMDSKGFSGLDLNTAAAAVSGHTTPRPKVGQTLVGEFQKSFIKFKFIEVKYCEDPPDMFFAKVKAIEQQRKE